MTMRESALALARQGFAVFPIKAGAKAPPLVEGWQRVATSEETQIESWWTQFPEANIGVHCDGLCVIDVDPKKGGFESLAVLEQEIELESTYEVETPSGGRHIYYRCETPIRNGVDVLGRGVDVRATGGYVLAPGSRTAAGEYRVLVDEPIAAVDGTVVERLAARPEAPAGENIPHHGTDVDEAVVRATEFLRTHPIAAQGYGGDHHTFRTICRLRDFGVPQDRAFEALDDWNARCDPPWEDDELAIKIANAYHYAQDPAGKLTPEALGFEAVAESPAPVDKPAEDQTPPRELMHPADVSLDEILRSEYLIKGMLERQSNAVLFGQWNVGKTFVVLDMAACIATGTPWFGKRVRQGRVLYLGYEGLRAMKKRLKALRDKYPGLGDKRTPFRYEGLTLPLTHGEGVREVGEILRSYAVLHGGPPDLVIIDPLANALGGDDSDAGLMGVLNQFVVTLIKKQKCTVLRVHHSGHGNQERARGHSSLPAGVDTEIRVAEQVIAATKQRDDVREKFGFNLDVVELGPDDDGDMMTTCIVRHVPDNALDPGLSQPQRELLDALIKRRGDGGTVSRTDINDCMPEGVTPAKKREMIAVMEKKMYFHPEGKGWVIAERGPMAIFD